MLSPRTITRQIRRPILPALLMLALTLSLFAGSTLRPRSVAATGERDDHGPDSAGFVYVDDNTTPTNTVAGFARADDGSLTPLAGSPFDVGGSGSGAGVASQGGVQVARDGSFLLVADAGSNQISVLRIGQDGSLDPVAGSPFSSGGKAPVSIAVNDDTVFVANSGSGGSNYTGFRLNGDGRLTPLSGSTFTVPDGSGLGDVLSSADGKHLVGTRVTTSLIDSFDVGPHGELTPAPGSPFKAQGLGPFGSSFRPERPDQVFISNAHNVGPLTGTVSAFAVARDAALTSIGASPFADHQTAPCWVVISPEGQYLFTMNTGSDSVSSYSIASDGALTLIGSTVARGGGHGTDLGLEPKGDSLYALDGAIHAVHAFAVSGGNLTELSSPPVSLPATATHPFGIAVR